MKLLTENNFIIIERPKCLIKDILIVDADGNNHNAKEINPEDILKAEREKIIEIIRLLKIEYANTPLSERGNGWNWLDKLEDKIKQ